jgi:hypothetical protein
MRTALALAVLCVASPVLAQAPAATSGPAQLRVTVLDQTSAGIPAAVVTVTIAGAAPVKVVADEHGVATIPGLAAAAAQIHVEAAGFLARDAQATLRRGTNAQTVTLAIEGFQEQVQVDDTAAAVQESGGAATTNVLDESVVEQLPDDPDELQAVLEQMAGGVGATFRVNGFTGGRLPNREDIRQIRFRTNSFAADNHDAGRVQIEIITRPNVTAWSGNLNANLRNDIFNARDAFAATKTPQNIARIGGGIRGPLAVRKTSLRLNLDRNESNTAANIYALKPDGSPFLGFVSNPSHNTFGVIGLEHALTEMQTLRVEYQRQQNVSRNGGVGGFNLPERANNRENGNGQLRRRCRGYSDDRHSTNSTWSGATHGTPRCPFRTRRRSTYSTRSTLEARASTLARTSARSISPTTWTSRLAASMRRGWASNCSADATDTSTRETPRGRSPSAASMPIARQRRSSSRSGWAR